VLLFLSAAVAGLLSAGGEYRPEAVNDQVISMGRPVAVCLPRTARRFYIAILQGTFSSLSAGQVQLPDA
jgi:hypothetical protein